MMPLWAAFKGDAMKTSLSHRDLGELHGPVLVFGGSYSNLQATEALLAEAQRRAIAPGNLICSGDVVAYCADGPATVAAIRMSGCVVVAGNCERQLAAGAQDCGCGFEDGSACDLLSMCWFGQTAPSVQMTACGWAHAPTSQPSARPDAVMRSFMAASAISADFYGRCLANWSLWKKSRRSRRPLDR